MKTRYYINLFADGTCTAMRVRRKWIFLQKTEHLHVGLAGTCSWEEEWWLAERFKTIHEARPKLLEAVNRETIKVRLPHSIED